jgi:hypothetical protein
MAIVAAATVVVARIEAAMTVEAEPHDHSRIVGIIEGTIVRQVRMVVRPVVGSVAVGLVLGG